MTLYKLSSEKLASKKTRTNVGFISLFCGTSNFIVYIITNSNLQKVVVL